MNTTDLGRLGEAKVIPRLVELGWYPFTDISGKCPVDIIAWKDSRTVTLQVKYCNTVSSSGGYQVSVGSIRPNRSGNAIHRFDGMSVDYIAAYLAGIDTICFVPAEEVPGRILTLHPEPVKTRCRLVQDYLEL